MMKLNLKKGYQPDIEDNTLRAPIVSGNIANCPIITDHYLPGGADYLLTLFKRRFHTSPFPLTTNKLETIVRAIDVEGPRLLGFYYPAELHKECQVLLPHPIISFFVSGFKRMFDIWCANPFYFRCRVIGAVLYYYLAIQSESEKSCLQ